MELKLTQEQITQMLGTDDSLKYLASRDSFGALAIDETSNFPQRLKFYMSKNQITVNNLVNFFKANYPSLLSSSSSIHHYLRGIRTPKLSVLLGIAECLNIAPSSLLPGTAGNYMVKEDDHVELLITKSEEIDNSDDIQEFNPTDEVEEPIISEPEEDYISEDPCDVDEFEQDLVEDNNVVINDNVVIEDAHDVQDDTSSIDPDDEDTIGIDEPSDDELNDLEKEIDEGLDSFDDIFDSDDDSDPFSTNDNSSDTLSWIKFTE